MSYNPTLFTPIELIEKMLQYTQPLEKTLKTLATTKHATNHSKQIAQQNYKCIKTFNNSSIEIAERFRELSIAPSKMSVHLKR